jgi:hypothetical protein
VKRSLFPWPSRRERRRRIDEARAGAIGAREEAARAARIERDLRRIVAENGFAEAALEGWMGRGRREH